VYCTDANVNVDVDSTFKVNEFELLSMHKQLLLYSNRKVINIITSNFLIRRLTIIFTYVNR